MLSRDKLEDLLQEIETNKSELSSLTNRLQDLANRVDDLIPENYSPRNRFVFEDKIKLITQLYDTILKYRTELGRMTERQLSIIHELIKEEDSENLVTKISALPKHEIDDILKRIEKVTDNK